MNMTDRIIIGQRIAELRKNKGLTQAELAAFTFSTESGD